VTWDYGTDYINPEIKIQSSTDGLNWTTLRVVNNVKTDIFESPYLGNFINGQTVFFRGVVNTHDYYEKTTNSIEVVWAFNSFIVQEISRVNNVSCGTALLDFIIIGTGEFSITWDFESDLSGGSMIAYEPSTLAVVEQIDSPADGT